MADYLSYTGLAYYHNRAKTVFADQDDIDGLQDQIDGLDIPSKVSDLVNDGDGTSGSRFATEAYVDQNGGKINSITVNGTVAPPDVNKNVALTVPTKVSDITNDSGFQDANDVSGAISDALANGADPYMTESDVQAAIDAASAAAFTYKGSVPTVADLPASGNKVGDVYDVLSTGVNYAWSGTAWDPLGSTVDLSLYWSKAELVAITTSQIDTLFA